MKHFFFDIGNGQLLGFMSGEDVEGYPKDFDSGINKGLGLMPGVYHFAFDADSLEIARRNAEAPAGTRR